MKVSLKHIQQGMTKVNTLIVQSFECEHYLVNILDTDGNRLIVCDNHGKPLSFRSQLDAKKPFKGLGVIHTQLEHQSPYNEMIGINPSPVAAMNVPISNPDQDYS